MPQIRSEDSQEEATGKFYETGLQIAYNLNSQIFAYKIIISAINVSQPQMLTKFWI